jgi:hypothetical protein
LIENVTELFNDILASARLQRFNQLMGFFKEILDEAAMGLLGIPGAASRGSQLVSGCNKAL